MASRTRAVSLPLMPLRPHPVRETSVAWVVGRHLFVYDTAACTWEQCRKELHGDTVRALDAFVERSDGGEAAGEVRWVSGGDDKQVTVWREHAGQWESLNELAHSKKVVAAIFDRSGRVLFADRFGDVYRWPWSAGEGEQEPQLLFTHLAIVTAMVLTESGRFLVTADNHEKVRVSCYPEAAEIHSFCLGHTAQITALACVGEEALASASADGTLRLWRLDGEQLEAHNLGAPATSLASIGGGSSGASVVVACEGAPGLRRVLLQGGAAPSEPEVLSAELPQAVCALRDASILWVDRAGHLRLRPAAGAADGEWAHAFQGEDLPPSLVCLSKNADPNWAEEAGAQEEGAAGAEAAARPRKRRTK